MSYRSACLHCSLLDKDLSEYIQWKKRNSGELPLKYAVAHVGVQEDGTWVVGENGCISPKGKGIPMEESVMYGSATSIMVLGLLMQLSSAILSFHSLQIHSEFC